MEPIQDLPTLPSDTSCHIHNTCTGVTCCADVTLLDRPISAFLVLDSCSHILQLGIEKFQFNVSLFDFDFGVDKVFHIDQVFKIQ